MIKRFKRWLKTDPRLASVEKYLRSQPRSAKSSEQVVLVQCAEDLYCFSMFGQLVSSLRTKQSVRVDQYVLRSLRLGEGQSLFDFIISRFFFNPLHNFKWIRLYESFCDGVAYRSTSLRPIADMVDIYRAWKCWRGLADKKALINLEMDGIVVGDLINDSFLRFKPAPTVDLKDFYLFVLLWQAYRDVRRAKDYFSRVKPAIYLTSYSTYIQHGVPVRVALRNGVRVFSFGNYQEFAKELTLQDLVHTKNPDDYATEFMKLDRQEERLALAEKALSTRLSGGVDSATAYMKKSAYAASSDPVPDVRGAVVIFLHDFYDSPHVYREMLFPDFWEWICFTIETLQSANIRFFIKPHPNQINLSDHVISDLERRYPGLSLISSGISNRQLVEAGISCALTVYGTIAHEMAYLGVPSIGSAHHPHISFDFCRTARSRDEYANLLRNSSQFIVDNVAMRRQCLVFYYMHNLNLDDETKSLIDANLVFRMACEKIDCQDDLVEMLKQISLLHGYQTEISRMIGHKNLEVIHV